MNMIGIFFAVFSRLLRMRWVLSVSLWAWLEPVFYCFMRMRRVPNVSKNQRIIGTGWKKKIIISWEWGEFQVWACEHDWNQFLIVFLIHEDEESSEYEYVRMFGTVILIFFLISWGWGNSEWVPISMIGKGIYYFSHFMRMRKFRVGAYKDDWKGYLLFFSHFMRMRRVPSVSMSLRMRWAVPPARRASTR